MMAWSDKENTLIAMVLRYYSFLEKQNDYHKLKAPNNNTVHVYYQLLDYKESIGMLNNCAKTKIG